MPRKKKSQRAKSDEERIFRIVLGSLKACIQAHGPIDLNKLGSASKRVSTSLYGAITEGHLRTVGRVVEGARLENESGVTPAVGSNPTPSAIYYRHTRVKSVYDDETGNLKLVEAED